MKAGVTKRIECRGYYWRYDKNKKVLECFDPQIGETVGVFGLRLDDWENKYNRLYYMTIYADGMDYYSRKAG